MTQETPLIEWIAEHKVCWELLPYHVMSGGRRTQVGYELYLYAQHSTSVKADPGCIECQKVYTKLQQIAHLALPKEFRPTTYHIMPFDGAFHMRTETRMKYEVQLTLQIIHREGFLNQVDECERKCADEIERNLREMGARVKAWPDRLYPMVG